MTFISHAQNGEDVILWRALGPVEKGFYVDIGACDPDDLSVTRAFYERGWSGINVEPSREFYERCVAARPRDINLPCAVTAVPGPVRFLNVTGTGLSTTLDDIAATAASQGRAVEAREVRGVTLANVCAMAGGAEIHFLKIDVEGAEEAVLRGGDFTRFRPWIVVVEATVPQSGERSEQAWESLLLEAGYDRCLFDGLNLYYLAREHAELAPRLTAGANVLDGYEPVALSQAREWGATVQAELQRELEQARQWGAGLEAAMAEQAVHARQLQDALAQSVDACAAERARGAEQAAAHLAWQAEATAREAALRGHMQDREDTLRAELAEAHAWQVEATAREAALRGRMQDREDMLRAELAEARTELAEARAGLAGEAAQAARLRARLDRLAVLCGHAPPATGQEDEAMPDHIAAHIVWRAQEAVALRAGLAELDARLEALTRSTSWRLTAPLRRMRSLLAGGAAPGPAPGAEADPKELARQMFHRGMRVTLRLPGARQGAALVRRMAPAPVEWLAIRFRAYEQRASAAIAVPPRLPLPAPELPGPMAPARATAAMPPPLDLSEEEARLYRQLATTLSSMPVAG